MKRLPAGKTIGLDTMVLIYHLENHADYAGVTEKLLDEVEKGRYRAVTSFVTLLEILVKPKKEGALRVVSDYRDLLLTFPNLSFLPLDFEVSDLASSLRAKYSIMTPDAIQIATAITGRAEAFITNDERLKKIEEIRIVMLSELK